MEKAFTLIAMGIERKSSPGKISTGVVLPSFPLPTQPLPVFIPFIYEGIANFQSALVIFS